MKPTLGEFEKLALEHIDMVDRVARTLTRNSAEADDLVQETYLRALQAWSSFDLRSFGIRPWLLRILHNIHITRSTREAKQPKAVEAEQLQAFPEPGEAAASRWEPTEQLDKALDRLPVELRTALTLWAVEELSYQEIAEAVGVPIGTVMSRLHRARQRLRQDLPEIAARIQSTGNRR